MKKGMMCCKYVTNQKAILLTREDKKVEKFYFATRIARDDDEKGRGKPFAVSR
jgi:hypothetical protein